MSEWEVVGVMIALVGLITAIGKPLMDLTRAITVLTEAVSHLEQRLERESTENRLIHERLCHRSEQHAQHLSELDQRVLILEQHHPPQRAE